ncbi:glycoside hydrolase family 26 protein [Streptomyces puniciscabiei]|uniref:glycoside hydrolase family 26 protein n=1 Tax=Streptomyces puniciscabiei TaxID=164348 RepID=UPI0006EBDED1|nr:glycosyl hydrolase [Streptomyces puniciscabiei]
MRFTVTRLLATVLAVVLGGYVFVVGPHLAGERERRRDAAIDAALPPTASIEPTPTGGSRAAGNGRRVFPARGDSFVGIMTAGGVHDLTEAARFTRRTGHRPQVYEFSQDWAHDRFDADLIDNVARRGMMPLLAWEPWDHREAGAAAQLRGDQPAYRLARIIDGTYDPYLRSWARGIASLRYAVGIRLAHEMNGYWYPWCEQSNGNHPGEYVRAWRHVHDIFVRAGATNAVWVWSPNVGYRNATPFERLYPGDAYVDWVGLSGYYGTVGKESYQSFDQLFSYSEKRLRRLTAKPLVITEVGATDADGRKAEWIADMFRSLPRHPDVIGVIWYEAVKVIDWRITTSAGSVSAFTSGMSALRYRTPWTPDTEPRRRL